MRRTDASPYGACLLGSLNIAQYLVPQFPAPVGEKPYDLDYGRIVRDVFAAVRAFDKVIDLSVYPLPQQEQEAKAKRRMGLGVTGMANALEVMGFSYASPEYLEEQSKVLGHIRQAAISASTELAAEKGSFPLFDAEAWLASGFGKSLPEDLQDLIRKNGLRNGQLLSIAPTGTISMCADNVSSGIEPPYAIRAKRRVRMSEGEIEVELDDFAYSHYGIVGRDAGDVSASEHIAVLCAAQKYIDSAVSKTCNVTGAIAGQAEPGAVTFDEFKDLYRLAYDGGAKGCTTFNVNGKRLGILEAKTDDVPEVEASCGIDQATGRRECA